MRYTFFLGLFLFFGCITHIECTPKAACNQTVACQPVTEECVNGVCECQKNHYISFTTNLEILCTPAPACSPDCEENQACIDGHCYCERGRVYVNDRCRLMAGFRKHCSTYAVLCDISANLSCAKSTWRTGLILRLTVANINNNTWMQTTSQSTKSARKNIAEHLVTV